MDISIDIINKMINEDLYHEPFETLSEKGKDIHRALNSLIEELQAIDWYNQRLENTTDGSLREIIKHNRDEEIEHAAMSLEWVRRVIPEFDKPFKEHLFKDNENIVNINH